ncbi:MAG: hypothetical protein MK161_07010 [Pirellulales bacterium]|nr:hypothetical protein [Pirellulales bacterium]
MTTGHSFFGAYRVILLAAILTGSLAGSLFGQAPDPLKWNVDKSLFPKAYGLLANEHLLYPVDQSNWPVKIDRRRQLFLDDYLIASRENVRRKVNSARKHPANPLIDRQKPWEGRGPVFHRVMRDAKTGKFRMWYSTYHDLQLPSGTVVRCPTCYATSDDGITWEKPELGLCEYNGSKANNIVILKGSMYGLMYEPDDPNPDRRYKAVVWHDWRVPQGTAPPEGYYLYTSPNGIDWTQASERPIALNQNARQPGIGDTSLFFRDDRLGRYVCYTKILFRDPTMRTSGMMESDDLLHWSRPRMTLYPDTLDDLDTQIYEHYSFYYESLWIGLIRVMHTELVDKSRKQTVVELTASRDGRHFTRVGNRERVIPLGGMHEWDPHYHAPTSHPILVGDEIWIYYFSMPLLDGNKVGKEKADTAQISRIGLAMLRRDGFVSLDAQDKPGQVITRPLTFNGTQLNVNAKIAEGGYLKVGLRDAAGKPVAHYQLADCNPVQGDVTSARVTWRNRDQVHRPDDQSWRLVFELKNAQLYSFWID